MVVVLFFIIQFVVLVAWYHFFSYLWGKFIEKKFKDGRKDIDGF